MHDKVYNRNREAAQYGWQCTHSPVWDVVGRITVTDVCEIKISLETDKPPRKSEQQLREWGMNIEIVLAAQVICGELSKMNLIEAVATENLVTCVLRRR